jgi:enterochelin esterase-like enzyme
VPFVSRFCLLTLLCLGIGWLCPATCPAAGPVAGPAPSGFDQPQPNVPQGKIESITYESTTTGGPRKAVVYTPPNLPADTKLPVLYLLHGSGDDETGWQVKGNAAAILDNLVASGRVSPLLVVMPLGFARKPGDNPANRFNFQAFEQDLLTDLVPHIEKTYPVKTGKADRAIAGLSMGAAQSLLIGLAHLDRFSCVGAFSGANFWGAQAD